MSGVSCLLARAADPVIAVCARRLSGAMTYFPHQAGYQEELCGGRVFIGAVVNNDGEDTRSQFLAAQGDLVCVVEGHIARAAEAGEASALLGSFRYAEAVLATYRKHGRDFARRLEGQFNAIVVDAGARIVLACNGRHAQSPLYMFESQRIVAVATALGPIGACGVFKPRLDQDAARTFLTYGQLFGEQTLLEGVTVLDGASVAEWPMDGPGGVRRRYWDYGDIGPRLDGVSMKQMVRDLCDLFNASADRMVRREGRMVSGLSGGNDSRLVTGLAARRRKDLRAWTFGIPGSSDLTIAAEICRKLGIQHLTFGIDPGDLERHAEDFATLVDGSMTAAHAFFLPRARQLGGEADVALNGYGGDYLLQGGLLDLSYGAHLAYWRYRTGRGPYAPHPHLEKNRDRRSIVAYLAARYGRRSSLAPLLIPSAPDFAIIANRELDKVTGRIPVELQIESWGFEQRGRRWTMLGSVNDRHFYGDDCIYYDDALFDRCLAAPPSMRRGNRLHNVVASALLPDVAGIVSSNTGLSAVAPAWRVTVHKACGAIGRRMRGQSSTFGSGVDIEGWARKEQKAFYLDLLADEPTARRSFWDARQLRASYEAHVAGAASLGHEMGLVAAVECFARRWLDSSVQASTSPL